MDNNIGRIEIEDLKQKIHSLDCELNQYIKSIKVLMLSNNNLKEKLTVLFNYSMQAMEQFKCSCANIINKTINTVKIGFVDEVGKQVSTKFPLGGSNIQDAMHDFEYAKKNPHAEVVEALDKNNNEKLNKIMEELKLKEGTKTVIYNENSAQSKKIFHSRTVQNYIKTNLANLIEAKGKPIKTIGLEFQADMELDLYLGIQHFTLHNPRITEDGYFEAMVYDKYDFEERPAKDWAHLTDVKEGETFADNIKTNLKNRLNNIGFDMQETGLLEKYELIYLIKEKVL